MHMVSFVDWGRVLYKNEKKLKNIIDWHYMHIYIYITNIIEKLFGAYEIKKNKKGRDDFSTRW